MKMRNIFKLFVAGLLFTSCSLLFKEEPVFNKSRVPGQYEGTITCSYEPCAPAGSATFTITEGESFFTLQFADSLSGQFPDLNFDIELGERSYGEAVTISGYISFQEGQEWELTPYEEHFFYYWTYYDTQQEGERFEMRIYKPGPDNTAPDPDYVELNGYKGVQ